MTFRPSDPIRDPRWLKRIRDMRCDVTNLEANDYLSIVPAHVRTGGFGGTGLKPSDDLVIPLRADFHQRQHQIGETTFWQEMMMEYPEFMFKCLRARALLLYRERDDGL